MNDDRRDEFFISRWSRQKRQAATSAPAVDQPAEPAVTEAEPFDLAELPNIDDLTADSDIAAFLRKGVPEALQRMALRKMWALDPSIRDFVEVAENQWDFNAAGGVPGLFQELAADTDVSLWLTQVSPSTMADVDQPVARDAQIASAANDAAVGDDPSAEESGSDRQTSDDEQPTSQPVGDAPSSDDDAMQQSNIGMAEVAPAPALDAIPRRRHGGASPR